MSSALASYKGWVKRHPGLVQNLDWLLYLGIWQPGRLGGNEVQFEAYHAAIGLLSVWHTHILEEDAHAVQRSPYSLWLDLLQQVRSLSLARMPACMGPPTNILSPSSTHPLQVETLVELRAVHMEQHGKMSRYSPLLILESTK